LTKGARTNLPVYEQRLTPFPDFLGFARIVEESVENPDRLASLIGAIKILSELNLDETAKGRRVSQFSDSIVISYPVTESASVFVLVNDVALVLIELANCGFLLRGGITIGQLIHTHEYLFGPAMIRAYQRPG